jgi:soluble lytic murein transglycosylase
MLCQLCAAVQYAKWTRVVPALAAATAFLTLAPSAGAASKLTAKPAVAMAADDVFLAAKEAVRVGDRERLALYASKLDANYPLAPYLDYWQVSFRVRGGEASVADVEGFYARYPGTFLADRLRADWVLALGARAEWQAFEQELSQVVWWQDDPQIRCYAALSRYQRDERNDEAARDARQLLAESREPTGDGCAALGDTLAADGKLAAAERIRTLIEQNQVSAAKKLAAAARTSAPKEREFDPAQMSQAIDRPAAWLARHERKPAGASHELALIALARLAREQPALAARYAAAFDAHFSPVQRAIAWGRIGHMAAFKLMPEALAWYRRGGHLVGVTAAVARSEEQLEWQVRAALRGDDKTQGPDWSTVKSAIERMPGEMQREPAWVYWHARALIAEGRATEAHDALRAIAGRYDFYGALAREELGVQVVFPPRAAPTPPEMVALQAGNPGFARALKFYELGLRLEGNREWNWQLRGMNDRQLLAVAEYARRAGVFDRMIASAERARVESDIFHRFPAPHRELLSRHAGAVGLDENWVYGLIRQESRFIHDARSSAGAQGLMQIMPATARYVARRLGVTDYSASRITDLETNLQLGTGYLKLVLDDLDGQAALATAAYNAGPSRARAWRAQLAAPVEGAIFAETIPFNETRDYVKKVMANAVHYAALFDNRPASLKKLLGVIAPRAAGVTELP